jgi:nucleotide-binding universal stress UspA family protein
MGRAETAQSSSSGPADSPPVLLATDGSPDARIALRVAVDLALRTGAPLHLLHAWMEPVWYDYMYGLPTTLEFRGEAEAVLKTEAARATRAGVPPVHAHLETGRPGWAAKREAERINSGLLVVGSRGLGAIGRFVTGSVSDELVQHAPCPVLVCRGDRRSWPPTHIVVGDDLSDDSYSAALAAARIAGALARPARPSRPRDPAQVRLQRDGRQRTPEAGRRTRGHSRNAGPGQPTRGRGGRQGCDGGCGRRSGACAARPRQWRWQIWVDHCGAPGSRDGEADAAWQRIDQANPRRARTGTGRSPGSPSVTASSSGEDPKRRPA